MSASRYTEDHEAFRAALRRFVERELAPHVDAWEEAGEFPRRIYREIAALGVLGVGYPEEFGGVPGDLFHRIVIAGELARAGSGGLSASLMSHSIGAPPILAGGSATMKARVLPEILRGEKISALAITEPSGGSDVAGLLTSARLDGNHYVVNGSKMFITSGMRADYITVAAARVPPACLCCWSRAIHPASRASRSRRWAGGHPTPRNSSSTIAACPRPTSSARKTGASV